jgi:hypothetical protein
MQTANITEREIPRHIFYFHERHNLEYRAITIAVAMFSDNIMISGIARCSWNDQFCKATGRKIAYGRIMCERSDLNNRCIKVFFSEFSHDININSIKECYGVAKSECHRILKHIDIYG